MDVVPQLAPVIGEHEVEIAFRADEFPLAQRIYDVGPDRDRVLAAGNGQKTERRWRARLDNRRSGCAWCRNSHSGNLHPPIALLLALLYFEFRAPRTPKNFSLADEEKHQLSEFERYLRAIAVNVHKSRKRVQN